MMGIYRITNLKNQKVYIGSAKNIKSRESEHFRELRSGYHVNRHLQYAFNKYGEDSFFHEIIEEVDEENKLLKREAYWINKHKSLDSYYGYNACPPIKGGEANKGFCEKVEGERNGRAVLKAKDIPIICKLLNEGEQLGKISAMYNIASYQIIGSIRDGKRWRDLSQIYLSNEILATWKKPPSPKGLHPDDISHEVLKLICSEINEGIGDEEIGDKYGLSDVAIACIRKGGCRHEESVYLLKEDVLALWPYNIHLVADIIEKQPKKPTSYFGNRLTPELIEKICIRINSGKRITEIAKEFDLREKTISWIKNGKTHRKYTNYLISEEIQNTWETTEASYGAADYIKEICEMLNTGYPREAIAKEFNVSLSAIREIHNGKTHKHLSVKFLKPEIIEKWNYKN